MYEYYVLRHVDLFMVLFFRRHAPICGFHKGIMFCLVDVIRSRFAAYTRDVYIVNMYMCTLLVYMCILLKRCTSRMICVHYKSRQSVQIGVHMICVHYIHIGVHMIYVHYKSVSAK